MAKIVIKLGGQVFSHGDLYLKDIASDLAALAKAGHQLVLVHGGGVLIDAALAKAGIQPQKRDGIRITDNATMAVVQPVLDGINASLTAQLTRYGLPVQGLDSGAGVLLAKPAHAIDSQGLEFDLGFVGNIADVDVDMLETLLDSGIMPLIAPLAVGAVTNCVNVGDDNSGATLFNVNADNVAAAVAEHIESDMLIFMSDVPGVIGPNSIGVKKLVKAHCDHLTAVGTVTGGMLTKLHNAFSAAESGVDCVQIIDGTKPHVLLESIYRPGVSGTLIAC
jgi:acetylglutamate kinase